MALTLCPFGCVATTAELMAYLRQESVFDIYQQSTAVQRVRRGRYACAHVAGDELAALRCGGVLDCVSALEAEGLDVEACGVELSALHVRFRRGDRWARPRITELGAPVIAHWYEWRGHRRTALENREEYRFHRPVVPLSYAEPREALAQALVCVAPEQAVRLIDAAAAEGLLTRQQLDDIVVASPRRVREALRGLG